MNFCQKELNYSPILPNFHFNRNCPWHCTKKGFFSQPHNPFHQGIKSINKTNFLFQLVRLLLTRLSIDQSRTDYFQTETTFYSKILELTQKLNLFSTSSNRKSMKLFTFSLFVFIDNFFSSFSFPTFFGLFLG